MSGPTHMAFPGSSTSAATLTPRQRAAHPRKMFVDCTAESVIEMVDRAYATMLRPPILRLLTDSREWRRRWR